MQPQATGRFTGLCSMLVERKTRVIDGNCHSRCFEPFLNASVRPWAIFLRSIVGWGARRMSALLSFVPLFLHCDCLSFLQRGRLKAISAVLIDRYDSSGATKLDSVGRDREQRFESKRSDAFPFCNRSPPSSINNFHYLQRKSSGKEKSRRRKGDRVCEVRLRSQMFPRGKLRGRAIGTMSWRIPGSSNVKL